MKQIFDKVKNRIKPIKNEPPLRYSKNNIEFPKLTKEQRLFFDINGYLIIEDIFSENSITKFKNIFDNVWKDYMPISSKLLNSNKDHELRDKGPGGCLLHTVINDNYLSLVRVEHYDQYLSNYFCNEYLLSVIEELSGSNVRLSASNIIINEKSDNPNIDFKFEEFHKANNGEYRHYYKNGLYHGSLMRAMLSLNDLTEDSGGTIFIPGTHKLKFEASKIANIVKQNTNMIKTWTGKAGSMLFFTEDLIHAVGVNKTNNRRMILGSKFAPSRFQAWLKQYEPTEEEVNNWPKEFKPLITGEEGYGKYGIQTVVKHRKI